MKEKKHTVRTWVYLFQKSFFEFQDFSAQGLELLPKD